MEKLNKIATLTGQSGKEYAFELYSFGEFEELIEEITEKRGAIYLFTNRYLKQGKYCHSYIYLGETDDVSTRYYNHHNQSCIMRHNSNCIGFYWTDAVERGRKEMEEDILSAYNFPCNVQNN